MADDQANSDQTQRLRRVRQKRGTGSEVLVPVIGSFFATIVGGLLTFWSTRQVAREEAADKIARDAYVVYADAQGRYTAANFQNDAKQKSEAEFEIRKSMTRIAIFAPANVIHGMASWIRKTSVRSACDDGTNLDIAAWQSIRSANIGYSGNSIPDSDMAMILFGCELNGGIRRHAKTEAAKLPAAPPPPSIPATRG